MKKIIAVVLVLACLALLGWRIYVRMTAKQEVAARRGPRALPVEVRPVVRRTMREVAEFTGTLLPASQFTVAPKVPGRLEKLMVNIGDSVANGALVAVLDSAEYAQDVAQATAELAVSRANLADARSARDVAEREHTRAKELYDQKVASEAELDQVKARFDATKAKYDVADAQIKQKQAALNSAQVRLSYTTIHVAWGDGQQATDSKSEIRNPKSETTTGKSEISNLKAAGDCRVVAERFVDEGTMLRANDPIVSIVDLCSVLAVINVIERDFPDVRVGQTATVFTDAYPDKAFTGKIIRRAPVLKTESRQARVEIAIDNPDRLLAPGMFVRVRIEFAVHPDATAVPSAALVSREGKQGVFLIQPSGGREEGKPPASAGGQETAPAGGMGKAPAAGSGAPPAGRRGSGGSGSPPRGPAGQQATVKFVPLKLGITDGPWVEVLEPVLTGQVVTLGQHLLEDGAAVMIPAEAATQTGALPAATQAAARPGEARP